VLRDDGDLRAVFSQVKERPGSIAVTRQWALGSRGCLTTASVPT
jgi:hypothetical protein